MPTFTQYIRKFNSICGYIFGAVGVTTSLLPFVDVVAPPGSNYGFPGSSYGYFTIVLLAATLVLTYALWSYFQPASEKPVMLATLIFGTLALAATGIYILRLMPSYIYIYEKQPAPGAQGSSVGEKVRVVVGNGQDSYTDEALKAIRENPDGRPSKGDLIEGFTLPHLDRLFKEDDLRLAVQRLAAGYLGASMLLFLTFCCLVFGEAMKRPHPPRTMPAP